MAGDEVDVGQRHVALDHVERRVAEDPLEAEHVTAVDEVAPGKRVAERVRAASPGDPGPALETLEDLELAGEEGFEPSISCSRGLPTFLLVLGAI